MRLIAYYRTSSRQQAVDGTADNQRREVRRWAKLNGHRIVAEFTDDAVSGKLPAHERPGLTEALRLLRKPPQAEGIVTANIERYARELHTQEAVLGLIWQEGGSVFTVDHGEWESDDPSDPYRTAFRQMRGVFAQLERATIRKRLVDGQAAKRERGQHAVGAYAFGSQGVGAGRDRDAGPNPAEQPAVARIVELRTAGEPYRAIAAALDAEGLKPRRAAHWSAMSVRAVAQRAGVA